MKRVLLALALLGVAVGANADPTNLEGGALITHYIPDFVFSEDPCGDFLLTPLTNCDDQINRIDTADYIVATWFVVASFAEEKEWCGVQFGLSDYDPAGFYYLAFGPCYPPDGGLEIASNNWPGPNEGSAIVVTGAPWTGDFIPLYYFNGYAYAYETVIQLVPDPTVATPFGGMGNCASPPEKWDSALGGMGINMDGVWVCGTPPIEYFVCCVGEDCYLVETEEECLEGLGGEFYPDLQSCEPNPCIVEAACCLMGDCVITTASGCEAIGGEFHEDWDSCEPNPCPAYGACCFDCDCVLLYEEECVAQGGIFVGGECTPNPCGTPAETTSWGTIKSLYR